MEKARHLNTARGLLQRQVALPEAVRRLSGKFGLSERQAYRYLEEASHLDRAVEVPEATMPITMKLPPRTVELLRKYARSSGLTIGAIVTGALNAFLRTNVALAKMHSAFVADLAQNISAACRGWPLNR